LERDLYHVLEALTVSWCMIAHGSDCNSQQSYHHDWQLDEPESATLELEWMDHLLVIC